jgi:hypothetical protein
MNRDELLKLCDYLECNDASMEAQRKAAAFIRQTLAQRTLVGLTDVQKKTAIWTDGTFGSGALWAEKKINENNI